MRHSLATDPKVMAIGKLLELGDLGITSHNVSLLRNALRYIVTGALHAVWCAADEHADSEVITGADLSWIDDVVDIPSFGKAMESVGWARVVENGLELPKFKANNTPGAERMRRYRERHRDAQHDRNSDGSRDVTGDDREEESREEKTISKNTHTTPSTSTRFVRPTLDEVRAYCLERNNDVDPEAFVNHYEANGWKVGGRAPMKDWRASVRTWEKNKFASRNPSNNGATGADRPLSPVPSFTEVQEKLRNPTLAAATKP